MKLLPWILAVCLLGSFVSTAAESKMTIRLASSDYQPYYGPQARNHGPLAELIHSAFASQQVESSIEFMPWTEALQQAQTADFAGLVCGWDHPLRRQHYLFSSPLYYNELRFFAYQKIGQRNLKLLAQQLPRLGLVKDYAYPERVSEAGFEITIVNSDHALLDLLLQHKVDLILSDSATTQYWLQQQPVQTQLQIQPSEQVLARKSMHLLISKTHPHARHLLQQFERGLQLLEKNGRWAQILTPLELPKPVRQQLR